MVQSRPPAAVVGSRIAAREYCSIGRQPHACSISLRRPRGRVVVGVEGPRTVHRESLERTTAPRRGRDSGRRRRWHEDAVAGHV